MRSFLLLPLLLATTAHAQPAPDLPALIECRQEVSDFTALAANYSDVSLRQLWQDWLYSKALPDL